MYLLMRSSPLLPLGLLLLSLAVGSVATPARGARIVGRGAEISIGRETASVVEQYLPVDKDPVAVARVRGIGRRLVASLEKTEYPFEFHVVEDGEINAFALPGGFVYMYRGLLQLLPSDDALASVLAHEISHVTRRHASRQFEKNLVITAGLTAILRGTGATGFGDAAGVVQAVLGIGFTRHDETDADATGLQLLAEAGYDTRAAAESMRVLERAVGKDSTPALLRTHPLNKDRITRLTELSEQFRVAQVARRAAAPPAPAIPPLAPNRLAGLEGFAPAPCEWFPLVSGARWSYAIRDAAEGAKPNPALETRLVVRALEALKAEPAGVFRMEYQFERGVRATRLVAASPDRYLSRGEAVGTAGEWKTEAVFPPSGVALAAPSRCVAVEKIQVPAGEFDALRVETADANGKVESIAWYARGVGLIRREAPAAGTVQELVGYLIPTKTQRAEPPSPAPVPATVPAAS